MRANAQHRAADGKGRRGLAGHRSQRAARAVKRNAGDVVRVGRDSD